MSRDAENRAKQASDRDMSLSKQYGAESDALSGQLKGIYGQQATNPQGMTDQELNDARTSSMESTGGGVASVHGEGNLEAERTGNRGGYQAALSDASRKGIATNATKALQVNNLNTALKEDQREKGIAGIQGLEGENRAGTLSAMGLDNSAINTQIEAGKSGWFQNMLGFMNAAGNVATGAGSMGIKPCWVAAELYGGWYADKTRAIRKFVRDDWQTPFGRMFLALYLKYGERAAELARRSEMVRSLAWFMFDRIYRKSVKVGRYA